MIWRTEQIILPTRPIIGCAQRIVRQPLRSIGCVGKMICSPRPIIGAVLRMIHRCIQKWFCIAQQNATTHLLHFINGCVALSID
jgi:hypothetical protein